MFESDKMESSALYTPFLGFYIAGLSLKLCFLYGHLHGHFSIHVSTFFVYIAIFWHGLFLVRFRKKKTIKLIQTRILTKPISDRVSAATTVDSGSFPG